MIKIKNHELKNNFKELGYTAKYMTRNNYRGWHLAKIGTDDYKYIGSRDDIIEKLLEIKK